MTDTLEYSDVAIPRERFTDALMAELEAAIAVAARARRRLRDHPARVHRAAARRRSTCSSRAPTTRAKRRAIRDYGSAIKELAAINIFAGDLLFKNFGVTRYGRVVFYDYDEIEYLTDCRFRTIPHAAGRRRRDVGRGLVSGRSARRIPRGVRDVPADRSGRARRRSSRSTPICSMRSGGRRCRKRTATAGRSKCCRIPESIRFRASAAADAADRGRRSMP